MLRLDIPDQPYWLELEAGPRLYVRPLQTPQYNVAKARNVEALRKMVEERQGILETGGKVDHLPDISDEAARQGFAEFLFTVALAQSAIMEWEGVGDEAGEPIPVSHEAVARLMRIPTIADDFIKQYTRHYETILSEGESSPAGANGTSQAAGATATTAAKTSSRARTGKKDKTGNDARTTSGSRKRTSAGKPGT